jgi:hypothetical protein
MKNPQMPGFMTVSPVRAELFQADRLKELLVSQFLRTRLKTCFFHCRVCQVLFTCVVTGLPEQPLISKDRHVFFILTRRLMVYCKSLLRVLFNDAVSCQSHERWMIVYGVLVEWFWWGLYKMLGEKLFFVPLCPPKIPHGSDLNWTQYFV